MIRATPAIPGLSTPPGFRTARLPSGRVVWVPEPMQMRWRMGRGGARGGVRVGVPAATASDFALASVSPSWAGAGQTITITATGTLPDPIGTISVGAGSGGTPTRVNDTTATCTVPEGLTWGSTVALAISGHTLTDALAIDPAPESGDTIYWDTRAGGAQDIQAEAVLTYAQAKIAGGFGGPDAPNDINEFTTEFEHSSNGRAIRWNDDPTIPPLWIWRSHTQMPDNQNPVYWSWKVWHGRTAAGGGVGDVGVYTYGFNNGHKMGSFYRGANSNEGKMTVLGAYPTYGMEWTIDQLPTGCTNPAWFDDLRTAPERSGFQYEPNSVGGGLEPTITLDLLNSTYVGTINAHTYCMKPEAVLDDHTGEFHQWMNGIKLFEITPGNGGGLPLGTLRIGELDIGWRTGGGGRTQTDYAWDFVLWQRP